MNSESPLEMMVDTLLAISKHQYLNRGADREFQCLDSSFVLIRMLVEVMPSISGERSVNQQ